MDNLEITISFPKDILVNVVEEVAKKSLQDEAFKESVSLFLLNIFSNINITKDISKKSSEEQFVPPTLEEVAKFNHDNHLHLDAPKFWSYYQKLGWRTRSGARILDWKEQMRSWTTNGYRNTITSPTEPKFSTADKDFNPNEIDSIKITRN